MAERSFPLPRARARWRPDRLIRRVPLIVPLLIIPSWIAFLLMDRDEEDTDHILFYYMPDLIERPLRVIPNLFVTPIVNTETDQILLITGLLGIFGVMVERRLGWWSALAIFWVASSVAAIAGGLLWHLMYPDLAHLEPIQRGGERIFNGASAGGFALLAAAAATIRRPWLLLGAFFIWEPIFWASVSRDFTSVFHLIAVATGWSMSRYWLYPRALERHRAGQPTDEATDEAPAAGAGDRDADDVA